MESKKQKATREVGLRLKEIRQEYRLSQTEMSARLGVTASGYHRNESGENLPGLVLLQRIREKFDISMDWLLFNEGPRLRKDRIARSTTAKQTSDIESLKRKLEELESKDKEMSSFFDHLPAITRNPEVLDMLETMTRSPRLFHEVMLFFQESKSGQPEPMESPPPITQPDQPSPDGE